jgi:hypothetical protein
VVLSGHFPKPYIEPKESNVRKSIDKEKECDKKRFYPILDDPTFA